MRNGKESNVLIMWKKKTEKEKEMKDEKENTLALHFSQNEF